MAPRMPRKANKFKKSKKRFGELSEGSWTILEVLGRVSEACGAVLEIVGGVFEALESILEALEVVLEAMLDKDSPKQA